MADRKRENFRWLIATGVFAVVLCAIVLLLRNCNTYQPPPDANAVRENPSPADFAGKWRGRWDGTWTVQFTITHDPKTQQLSVLYEWEERPGEPLNQRNFPATVQGNALVAGMIEITLFANDPKRATATGHFRNPRTAALVREP